MRTENGTVVRQRRQPRESEVAVLEVQLEAELSETPDHLRHSRVGYDWLGVTPS
jgi:hypothetical protein